MAFSKSIAFKGTTLGYHKISDMRVSYIANPPRTEVGLLSYVDKAARDADPNNNLQGCYIMLEGVPPGDPTPADVRAWAYEQIRKQKPEWADATNA